MQAIAGAYKDSAEPKTIQSTGMHVAAEKYIVLKADDRSLYGKKVSENPLALLRSYVPQPPYRVLSASYKLTPCQ